MDTHLTTPSPKTLMIFFIGGSVLFLFLVVVTFFVIKNNTFKHSDALSPTPSIAETEPTLVKISPSLRVIEPSSQPITVLSSFISNFTFTPPASVSATVTDYSSTDLGSTRIETTDLPKSFFVMIDDAVQKVASSELDLNPGKQSPRVYAYSPQDFETIAIVDGKELLVSRTGAADTMVVNNNERIFALPEMSAKNDSTIGKKTEYYVYQKYGKGISEYLSIFQPTPGTYPSYTNYTLISYYITDSTESNKWPTHKKTLTDILNGLRKK